MRRFTTLYTRVAVSALPESNANGVCVRSLIGEPVVVTGTQDLHRELGVLNLGPCAARACDNVPSAAGRVWLVRRFCLSVVSSAGGDFRAPVLSPSCSCAVCR